MFCPGMNSHRKRNKSRRILNRHHRTCEAVTPVRCL
jgi:hypothetical protein